MRQKVTKNSRNVLRERAITVIGALSPCAIYPRNNVKRDIMEINERWKGGCVDREIRVGTGWSKISKGV